MHTLSFKVFFCSNAIISLKSLLISTIYIIYREIVAYNCVKSTHNYIQNFISNNQVNSAI